MARQTRTIPIVLVNANAFYRCPFLPVLPGQQLEVRGQVGNNAAGIKMWIQQVPPGSQGAGYTVVSPGTAQPIGLDIQTTEDLWFATANANDVILVTVRDSVSQDYPVVVPRAGAGAGAGAGTTTTTTTTTTSGSGGTAPGIGGGGGHIGIQPA